MSSLSVRGRIAVLVTLAIVAYLPALRLPFIADDYTQIPLARHFAAEGWTPLLHEVNLRSRATYMLLSAVLDRTFGFNPTAFYAASLLLHALCVLLVYASGVWTELGEPVAFWAAAFFAIEEGHQEAVMWPAAAGDLLVFLFGMAAWVCWVKWLQGSNWKWYAAAIASFLLAAASKESVWVFAVLMLLPVVFEPLRWRRGLAGAAPFLAMAAVYMFWTWNGRVAGAGYHDNRFSLSAPWLRVLLNSWWRLLFVWGLAALAILLWVGNRTDRRLVSAASLWMILGLLPYSFLTYMLQIPSRQTYLASAGLAWLAGAAAARLSEQRRDAVLAILCVAALAVNLEILWVKKMSQFRERGEPSELLRQAAAEADGSVTVSCAPLPDFVVEAVLRSAGTSAVFEHPGVEGNTTCFKVEYRNRQGQLIHESRKLNTARHGTFY
jgi:hypothetical protein